MPGNMTHKTLTIIGLVAVLFGSACDGSRAVFGEEKEAPDEFAVYERAPLSLPPDFGLRPPKPGANRPQTVQPRNDAKEALLGRKKATAALTSDPDLSPGMVALIRRSGGDRADPNIRLLVNKETDVISGGDENFVDSILFWRNNKMHRGAVLDPEIEERRMRMEKAKGESVVDDTPQIRRKSGASSRKDGEGFWGSLFD